MSNKPTNIPPKKRLRTKSTDRSIHDSLEKNPIKRRHVQNSTTSASGRADDMTENMKKNSGNPRENQNVSEDFDFRYTENQKVIYQEFVHDFSDRNSEFLYFRRC